MPRKLTIKEIKKILEAELGPIRDPLAMKVKVKPWWKAEPENDIDWMKQLKIKEIFRK